MKIRPVVREERNRVYGLLRKGYSFFKEEFETIQRLHRNDKELYEWVCIHKNKNIAYIVFSKAYKGKTVCGLHLLFLFVKPEFQGKGIGTELMRFALRQKAIKGSPLYVLGDINYFSRFGFGRCNNPKGNLEGNKRKLLSTQKRSETCFTIGYEKEVTYK